MKLRPGAGCWISRGAPTRYCPAPGPENLCSGSGTLQGRSGMCLDASGLFLASNLHVDMLNAIVKSIESTHLGILNIWGGSFASPSGRTHFRKSTPKTQIDPNIVLIMCVPINPKQSAQAFNDFVIFYIYICRVWSLLARSVAPQLWQTSAKGVSGLSFLSSGERGDYADTEQMSHVINPHTCAQDSRGMYAEPRGEAPGTIA